MGPIKNHLLCGRFHSQTARKSQDMNRITLCSALALILFSSLALAAEPLREPDEEKRSSIHAVDGYAYLSEDKTMAQLRQEALELAKRHALTAARSFITSKTKVSEGCLEYDIITAESEGSVTILEQKDHGIEDNRYHVWIRAEVRFDVKQKSPGTPLAKEGQLPNGPLTVKIWSEKRFYRHGEKINIYMQGNHDFYARVVDYTSSGEIVQLLPNAYRSDSFFKAGEIYRIPNESDQFEMVAREPYGEDRIVVYASDSPLPPMQMHSLDNGLQLYGGTKRELEIRTRGIGLQAGQKGTQGAEFYETTWGIVVAP
jgi:hypothetical protein